MRHLPRRAIYLDGSVTPALVQPGIDVAAKYGAVKAVFTAAEIISTYASGH